MNCAPSDIALMINAKSDRSCTVAIAIHSENGIISTVLLPPSDLILKRGIGLTDFLTTGHRMRSSRTQINNFPRYRICARFISPLNGCPCHAADFLTLFIFIAGIAQFYDVHVFQNRFNDEREAYKHIVPT